MGAHDLLGSRSRSSDHPTPSWLFQLLDRIYCFDLDVAAGTDNAKCERFFTEADDGLAQRWTGRVWMNPPYGDEISAWVKKAYDSVRLMDAVVVVGLLPVRTSSGWWHEYIEGKARIEYVRGRLRFDGNEHDAPFASCVAVWMPELSKRRAEFMGTSTAVKDYVPDVKNQCALDRIKVKK